MSIITRHVNPPRRPKTLGKDVCWARGASPAKWQPLRFLSYAVSALCLSPAYAASIGELRVLSHLGEPLRVEIAVQSENRLEPGCIQVGPPEGSVDDVPWVRGARIAFADGPNGQRRLLVTSTRPMDSPVVMLGVFVGCGVQLRREYTLLIDPPNLQELSSPLQEDARVEPKGIASSSKPQAGATWRTEAGESADSIAANVMPRDKAARRRLAETLVAQNQAALGDKATTDTPFPEGSVILIPAKTPVAAGRLQPTEAMTASPTQPALESRLANAPSRSPSVSKARLIIGEEREPNLQLATSIGSRKELREEERERLRTEMRLIASLDDKIATQLELTDKLRRLEALQEQLRNDAARLESEIQRNQASLNQRTATSSAALSPALARRSLAPTAPAQATPDDSATNYPRLILALCALLALLAAWLWYRKRHSSAASARNGDAEKASNAREGTSGENMDEFFEPLNEEDIWPERSATGSAKQTTGKSRSATSMDGALGPSSLSSLGPMSILHINEDVEEHDSAVELAEIMMSFGRVHGAAQTLADFIRANPTQAVKPWIKLLEVYRAANMRTEFDALCTQLNKTFNVQPVAWEDFEGAMRAPESLESMEHIMQRLCDSWGKRECQAYLHELLRDNRQGTRQGFPLAIIDEILLLLAILESHIGAFRPEEPAPITSAPPSIAPDTMQLGDSPMIAPLDLRKEEDAKQSSRTAVDFDIEDMDLSKTLHIDLDELGPFEASNITESSHKTGTR